MRHPQIHPHRRPRGAPVDGRLGTGKADMPAPRPIPGDPGHPMGPQRAGQPEPGFPFGGFKPDSGLGREGLGYSIDECTRIKTVVMPA